ncbi:MAG: thiol-disulfide oxidoreductase DCC family protein [Lentimicrobium sp.]
MLIILTPLQITKENLIRIKSELPDEGGLVIFDGSCVLCNSAVSYLLKKDKSRKLCFATFSSEFLKDKLASSIGAQFPDSIVYIDQNGIFTESDAVLKIAGRTGSFPLLSRIGLFLPKIFMDSAYRLVARYRTRWFGKTSQCIVPSASDAGRFFR